MLTRFLIVILAVLNVGVALWWLAPRPQTVLAPVSTEPGVATLELLPGPATAAPQAVVSTAAADEANASTDNALAAITAAPAAVAAKPAIEPTTPPEVATPPAKPVPEQCVSLGPFADAAKAQSAIAALGADALRSRTRETPGKPASSYRVFIAPAATREEAQATAKRIVEAGFSDYFIVSQGEEANAVALGQYRNREGAQRRLSSLEAAGFPARLAANGNEIPPGWWLDVAMRAGVTPAALQQRTGAGQQQSLDCARLR
jgi:hypothetical protein